MTGKADLQLSEELLGRVLLGKRLEAVEMPAEGLWDFQFAGTHLTVEAPWRIVDNESIRLGSCDHNQRFGLPEAVNALSVAMELLGGRAVEQIVLFAGTADLKLGFKGGLSLCLFNQSSGYEGWNISSDSGVQVIALGGGDLAIFGK